MQSDEKSLGAECLSFRLKQPNNKVIIMSEQIKPAQVKFNMKKEEFQF